MSETGKVVRSPEKISWCRLWHEMTEDPKLRLVAHKSGCSMAEVLGVFAAMMTNASAAENRGTLKGWDQEAMAYSLGITEDRLAAIYAAMQGKVLDGDRLSGWERRQPKRERDNVEPSTERVREHRARKAAQSETGAIDGEAPPVLHGVPNDETPCNTMKRHETCREEKSRYISPPLGGDIHPARVHEGNGGGGSDFVEFADEPKPEARAAPSLPSSAAAAPHTVEESGTPEALTEPSAARSALVSPAAPPPEAATAAQNSASEEFPKDVGRGTILGLVESAGGIHATEQGTLAADEGAKVRERGSKPAFSGQFPCAADDGQPWDDDPCDPRGPRLKAPSGLHHWDWVAVQSRLKASPRADAVFLARILAEADRDPLRRHWRSELDQLICDAQPDSVPGFAAHRVRRWLEGNAPPPPPKQLRYADPDTNPAFREFLANYAVTPQREVPA